MVQIIRRAQRLLRRRRPTFYLVSTAGHPNYGDELITRAWLDEVSALRPDADIWLDCPHPGRAVHLFGDVPHVRFTSTLWELAHASPSHDPLEDHARVVRQVRDLGTPRVDAGLLALRGVSSIHLLGGGYLNDLWQDNLGLISAVGELRRAFGVPVHATGMGVLPLSLDRAEWMARQLDGYALVEARDEAGAAALGVASGFDDAFLALAGRRPVFDDAPSPDVMVLVQGDLRAWTDEQAAASIASFIEGPAAGGAGVVEAVPPDDATYLSAVPEARFYPFDSMWRDGLPARPGQRWLTTRFHAHLMAAAAGASGTILAGLPGYYDHKHASLRALGTGWNIVTPGTTGEALAPGLDPEFPERALRIARDKQIQARRIYRP